MSEQPGRGCADPRDMHPHWCGFCGARQIFAAVECVQLVTAPPCSRCGEADWRNEADELAASPPQE